MAKVRLDRVERIDDPDLVDALGSLLRRRGWAEPDQLLVYRNGTGWRRVCGADINEYVRAVLRLEVSAKDFRTWHGTVLGATATAAEHQLHRTTVPGAHGQPAAALSWSAARAGDGRRGGPPADR